MEGDERDLLESDLSMKLWQPGMETVGRFNFFWRNKGSGFPTHGIS